MKKEKEKEKRKKSKVIYCFFPLLLIGLLLVGLFFGSNSADKKASAMGNISLVRNGYKYNFGTSLNDFRKNGIMTYEYSRQAFYLTENGEGIVEFQNALEMTEEQIQELFVFYSADGEPYEYTASEKTRTEQANGLAHYYDFETKEGETAIATGKVTLHLGVYAAYSSDDKYNLNSGLLVQLAFVKTDISVDDAYTDEGVFHNTVYVNYYLSRPTDFTVDIDKEIVEIGENYNCRCISVVFAGTKTNNTFSLIERRTQGFYSQGENGMGKLVHGTYTDATIIENETAYIVKIKPIYEWKEDEKYLYQGYYILEEDLGPVTYLFPFKQTLNQSVFFGLEKPIESHFITYEHTSFGDGTAYFDSLYIQTADEKMAIFYMNGAWNNDYFIIELPSLCYLDNPADGKDSNFLADHIADKVTGIEYTKIVETEAEKLEERTNEDLSRFFAFGLGGGILGLLGGIIFGNPVGGLLAGLGIGGGIGALPLIGDLLQALGISTNIGNFIRSLNFSNIGLPLIIIVVILGIVWLVSFIIRSKK